MLLLLFIVVVVVVVCCCCLLLLLYDAGMYESDNKTLTHEIKNNTVYQFRVQLSPAHSCHCVNTTTVGDVNLVNRWCETSSNVLCAKDELTTITYLSQPVTMMNGSIVSLDCDHPFVTLNDTDIAIAHEGKFECYPKNQCLFPLMPLTSVNDEM